MANLIARIAVLLVLAAAGMVLADRKEKIDLSVSLLLFLAAVNVTSFFSLKDNRIVPLRSSSRARPSSVRRVYTTPEGLLGELMMMAWVRGVRRRSTWSRSIWNASVSAGTTTR